MKDTRSSQQRILEAIELSGRGLDEASRAASADHAATLVGRPDLQKLCDRSKQLDETLRGVLCDVPVPEGLERRILDHLRHATAQDAEEAASGIDLSDESAPERPCVARQKVAKRSSRRRWMAATAGVLAGCALVVGLLVLWPSEKFTLAQILDAAEGNFVPGDVLPGEAISEKVLASYPFSGDVHRLPGTRWHKVKGFLNRECAAYEMSAAGGTRATLFVVPLEQRIDGLDVRPPGRPQQATGRTAIAAWQTDGVLYVMVVKGNARTYRRFLAPGRPIA